MCTIMEKEDLLLDVSETAAFISNRFLDNADLPDEFNRCADIRDFLSSTSYKEISRDDVLNELKSIKEKYVDLPEILD